jgi:dolichol-phosphate mannosyltransferase
MRIVEFPVPLIYLDEERSFGGSLDDARRRQTYYQEVLKREMQAQSVACGGAASGVH